MRREGVRGRWSPREVRGGAGAWAKRRSREGGRGRCFFFSSRRRHTRLQGDWSSDVCSSDLEREPCHVCARELMDAEDARAVLGDPQVELAAGLGAAELRTLDVENQGLPREILDRKSVV